MNTPRSRTAHPCPASTALNARTSAAVVNSPTAGAAAPEDHPPPAKNKTHTSRDDGTVRTAEHKRDELMANRMPRERPQVDPPASIA
ncbi:hypothetical protein ASA1KI_11960 [Opitutales bacterium ASA1]|nr:hypothetical protein ASA1KI_11960 [Opitutales bacterium ASA1]